MTHNHNIRIPAVAAVVLSVVFATGCKEKKPPAERKPVNVTVEVVRPITEFRDTFVLPGVVEPNRVVKVCAEVAARIEAVHSREGVPVTKGAELVHLNTDLLKAELDREASQLKTHKLELARVEKLFNRKPPLVTENELDQARNNVAASQAAFDQAKANHERAKILAPISGILDELPMEEGEYAQPGACVARIVDIDTAKVVVDVPERDVGMLKKGDPTTVFAGMSKPRPFEAHITYISQLAHPDALTTRTEVSVPNKPGSGNGNSRALRSGQIVRVRLTRQILKNAVMVPLRAILPLERGYTVYVVEDGKAQPRLAEVGLIQKDRILITNDALKAGDRLIVAGHQYVGPGQAVAVRKTLDRARPVSQPVSQPARP